MDIRAEVGRIREVIVRQTRFDEWHTDGQGLHLRDPELIAKVAFNVADAEWASVESSDAEARDQLVHETRVLLLQLLEKAIRLATIFADPHVAGRPAPDPRDWIGRAFRELRIDPFAGSGGLAVRLASYGAFLDGAEGKPVWSEHCQSEDWSEHLDPLVDPEKSMQFHYLLGAASAGDTVLISSHANIEAGLDLWQREELIIELIATSWVLHGVDEVTRRGCARAARRMALDLELEVAGAGSDRDLGRILRYVPWSGGV